jgi:formiminotetrahydrofolate cyclodeaminase
MTEENGYTVEQINERCERMIAHLQEKLEKPRWDIIARAVDLLDLFEEQADEGNYFVLMDATGAVIGNLSGKDPVVTDG